MIRGDRDPDRVQPQVAHIAKILHIVIEESPVATTGPWRGDQHSHGSDTTKFGQCHRLNVHVHVAFMIVMMIMMMFMDYFRMQ